VKEAKGVDNENDLRRGRFSFRKEEDIWIVISDKHPQRTNCSRSRKTTAVPRNNLHEGLGANHCPLTW
jgi:hypothetical protein